MMGWRECHGVETRITMTALSGRNDGVEGVNDGVEGVSWRGYPYHNDCRVQTE